MGRHATDSNALSEQCGDEPARDNRWHKTSVQLALADRLGTVAEILPFRSPPVPLKAERQVGHGASHATRDELPPASSILSVVRRQGRRTAHRYRAPVVA
jgi:hypothetical protein